MSCSNQIICYTSPHLSLHVPFFFLLIILTHCYVIVYSFYYPPLQAYLQYKKSFHYISNPSCVGLITALCSLSNSNIVISFLIMLIGTLLYKSEFIALKEKGSGCVADIYFFWRDTDKIISAKHDRHEVAEFWRCKK